MSQISKFNKKWGSSVKRTVKDAKMKEEKNYITRHVAQQEVDPYKELDKVIARLQIPVAGDYVAMNKGFLNKLRKDIQKEMEDMELNKIKSVVEEVIEKKLFRAEEIALEVEKEKTRQLELQIRLLELQSHTSLKGKVEEVPEEVITEEEARALITEQFEEESSEDFPETDADLAEVGRIDSYVIPMRGKMVNWKEADEYCVTLKALRLAHHDGVDVTRGSRFSKHSKLAGGVYQRFMNQNKGIRGAWEGLVNENWSLITSAMKIHQ